MLVLQGVLNIYLSKICLISLLIIYYFKKYIIYVYCKQEVCAVVMKYRRKQSGKWKLWE